MKAMTHTVSALTIVFSLLSIKAEAFEKTCKCFVDHGFCFRSTVDAKKNSHRPPLFHVHVDRNRMHLKLYRKFHDYAWNKIISDGNSAVNTVPDELISNSSPAKGAASGTNVVASMRSISQFPSSVDDRVVIRLARSALLETQISDGDPLISPMTIHVLNFVSFPSPYIQETARGSENNGEYLEIPIFGADIVSLPGNKHLVAIDFQPVVSRINSVYNENDERVTLLPTQFAHIERKLQNIHSKYQKNNTDSSPLLPWGGDIPPQAMRFFSPYALWTRLGDDKAIDTVNTVVWDAFKEYFDLYSELMRAVGDEISAGKLKIAVPIVGKSSKYVQNPVWKGQIDYLEYRRTNDPARPMLQRLYGNDWSERVIKEVLFPDL